MHVDEGKAGASIGYAAMFVRRESDIKGGGDRQSLRGGRVLETCAGREEKTR
jgi:hypothetical protein